MGSLKMSEGVNRHHDAVPTAAALDFDSSFESLNNDCLVNIFSYIFYWWFEQ